MEKKLEDSEKLTQELLIAKEAAQGEERKQIISEITRVNYTYIKKFVHSRYGSTNFDTVLEDLISECVIAFMDAMERYVPTDEATYITYSYKFLLGAASRYFDSMETGKRTPAVVNARKLRKTMENLGIEEVVLNTEENIRKISENLGWSQKYTKSIIAYMYQKPVHIDLECECQVASTEKEVLDSRTHDILCGFLKENLSYTKVAVLDAFYGLDIFPELQELMEDMSVTDALNVFLGKNHVKSHYTLAKSRILSELRKNGKGFFEDLMA